MELHLLERSLLFTQDNPKDFLAYYASQFNTVEVDSTFYRIPSQTTVENWRRQVPEGFLFALKFPQIITHVKALKGCEQEIAIFLSRAELLGDRLGPLLLVSANLHLSAFLGFDGLLAEAA